MTRYRKIDPRIWNDEKFIAMSHEAQRLFLFVLTHPWMTMLGAFRISQAGMAEELGLSTEAFREAFGEVLAKGLVKYDRKAFLIWAPNFLKYNEPESPNVVRSWGNVVDLLPECELKSEVLLGAKALISRRSEAFTKALPKAFLEALPEALSKGMPNQEQEQEQEPESLTNNLPVSVEPASVVDDFCLSVVEDGFVEIGAPLREHLEAAQLQARGDLDDPKHIMTVVDMVVVAKTNGVPLSRNIKLEEIAKAGTITLELFTKCIKTWRSTQTGIGYLVGILANAAKDPSLFDDKPAPKKKEVTAETISDSQAWLFANRLAYNHSFGSRYGKTGEEYNEFIPRIAEQLKDANKFEEFRPYLVKLNLIEQGA